MYIYIKIRVLACGQSAFTTLIGKFISESDWGHKEEAARTSALFERRIIKNKPLTRRAEVNI